MDTYSYIPPRRKLFNSDLVYDETQALEVRDEFYLYYIRATTDFMSPAFKRNIIWSTLRDGKNTPTPRSEELIESCRQQCTIPQFVKDDINSGNAKLVIDYSTEGYWDIDWKFLVEILGVNEDRMIWLTSLYNFSDVTNKEITHRTVPSYNFIEEIPYTLSIADTSAEVKYNPLWERIVHGMLRMDYRGINKQLSLIAQSHIRKSKGILYNRRPHPHRIALLTKMKYHNELDNMIWSWGGLLCDSHVAITEATAKEEIKNHEYASRDLLDEKYKETYNTLLRAPQYSDNEDLNTNKMDVMNFTHIHNTYYQVLTETFFREPGVFLSEKSYKPFISCQPFVLCGQTGTVDVLRHQGYDVYDKWINHDYDIIEDNTERLTVFTKEIIRLNSLSPEEWTKMLKEMLPTIKRNLQHLIDSGNKEDVISFNHDDVPMPPFDL